jgi:hypothetical protein
MHTHPTRGFNVQEQIMKNAEEMKRFPGRRDAEVKTIATDGLDADLLTIRRMGTILLLLGALAAGMAMLISRLV